MITNFFIDAPSLTSPARKPKHLAQRMGHSTRLAAKETAATATLHDGNVNQQQSTTFQEEASSLRQLHVHKLATGHHSRHEQFLKDRKMKLLSRNNHVQKVVQTIKEKTAQEQQEKRLRMQKTLEKAHRNRVALLERQSSFHGTHVLKAKKIALSRHQKMVEDRVLLGQAIDQKIRTSAEARKELLSVPRSRLLDPSSRASHQHVAAKDNSALQIQKWYRQKKFTPIAKIYKKIGLSRQRAAGLSFDQLSMKITAPTIVKATGYVIIRAKRITGTKTVFKNPARVLLSAFMLHFYPQETLTAQDGQEQDLAALADKLITDLDFWINSTNSAVIAPLASTFMSSFESYYSAFEAWKSKDTLKIVDELIGHFMELDQVWIKVFQDEGAMEEWAMPIKDQQDQHLKRIKKFGADAVERLRLARQSFIESLLASDLNVVIAPDVVPTCPAHEMYLAQEKMDTVMQSSSDDDDANVAETVGEDRPSASDMSTFGSLFSNEQLAHELVMDPEFKLKPAEKSQLEKQVEAMTKKAFADSVRGELASGNYSNSVMGLLIDIRSALIGMVNEKGPVAREINEVFDTDFLTHQIQNNVFDLKKLLGYAGEKMLQLCAPVRDASIRALATSEDMTSLIFQMLDILEEMKLDLANFRLQTIKPELKKQAVAYERQRFDAALQNGSATLVKTDAWLLNTYTELQKVADERNPENIDHPDLKVKFGQVFNTALLSMLFSTSPINQSTLPETFAMDAKRLFEMQNELQACAIVAALTMLSKNIIPQLRSKEVTMKELAASLFKLLKSEGTTTATLATEIISSANIMFHKQTKLIANLSQMTSKPTDQSLKQVSSEQETLVHSMVEKTLSYKDPFFSVLSRRMERLVKTSLEKEFRQDALKKNGLELIDSEFTPLVKRITALAQHNRDVFGFHYDSILKKYIV